MTTEKTLPIPWQLSEHGKYIMYFWPTRHFEATIQSDGTKNFFWNIEDLSQGAAKPFLSGHNSSFKEAENEIKGFIGKSYETKDGYRPYAGKAATTFRIFNGREVDFGPLESKKAIVTVKLDATTERTFSGVLHVSHYELQISPEYGNAQSVPPSHIVSIKSEYGGTDLAVDDNKMNNKTIRTYEGSYKQGCTGRAGFMENTVEHSPNDGWCPIHD